MKAFLDEEFLLQNEPARRLYHGWAEKMPIVDYHCHIDPRDIAEDRRFDNITQVWLGGDHYKWRLIRSNGVPEEEITGNAPDRVKFQRFAEALPRAIGNPLYHWTHLELKRYFGYDGVEPAKSELPPQEVEPDVEVLMSFTQVNEQVTAKESTNLRSAPSQGEDSQVLYTLQNGEVAQRIGVSSSGWSKLIYQGETYYAVSSYLTTDLDGTGEEETTEFSDPDGDGIQTEFTEVNEEVTAKDVVNLRKLPSVEHEDAEIVGQLNSGDVATRVGISDNGWSKLEYNGMTCYAVSSYLERTDEVEQIQATGEDYVIQTQFVEVNEQVTPKEEVNLRTLPSVEHPDSQVVATIYSGDIVTRTGINEDVGWSRVEYNGQTLYCVSSYIQLAQ